MCGEISNNGLIRIIVIPWIPAVLQSDFGWRREPDVDSSKKIALAELLERRLRNFGMIVLANARAIGGLGCRAKLRIVVTPRHLEVAGGAIQKKPPLFA
jgi:hypothetical protein